MELLKLNPCNCKRVPDLISDDWCDTIKCECGIEIKLHGNRLNYELFDWWNEKHPIEDKELSISRGDYIKKTRELLSSQPTPNCGICEWNLVMVGQNQILNSYCTAQGRKVAAVCYNSDECKKLFSESKPLGGKDE